MNDGTPASPSPAPAAPVNADAPPAAHHDDADGNANVAPRDLLAARYGAARGFLLGEWFGAILLLGSFTVFGWAVVSSRVDGFVGLIAGLAIAALGGFVHLRSRRHYLAMDIDAGHRSHNIAAIVAGSGGLFWLLFGFLMVLTLAGVPILPE